MRRPQSGGFDRDQESGLFLPRNKGGKILHQPQELTGPTFFSSGAPSDIYWPYVKLLMPMSSSVTQDLNGSQVNTITTGGSPALAAGGKFTPNAWFMTDLSNNVDITVVGPSDWRTNTALGFTLEMWVYVIASPVTDSGAALLRGTFCAFFTGVPNGSNCIGMLWTRNVDKNLSWFNASYPTGSNTLPLGTFHHIYWQFDPNGGGPGIGQLALGIDGVRKSFLNGAYTQNWNRFGFGNLFTIRQAFYEGGPFNYTPTTRINDIRFTDGVARYPGATYTVPTAVFPAG